MYFRCRSQDNRHSLVVCVLVAEGPRPGRASETDALNSSSPRSWYQVVASRITPRSFTPLVDSCGVGFVWRMTRAVSLAMGHEAWIMVRSTKPSIVRAIMLPATRTDSKPCRCIKVSGGRKGVAVGGSVGGCGSVQQGGTIISTICGWIVQPQGPETSFRIQ